MPFISSPNIFSRLKPKNNHQKKERPHLDGIFVNLESPEAFDEIFFKMFNNQEVHEEIYNFFNLILINKNKERYLSKNNINYKRIDKLSFFFKNAFFIIPIREPIQHANSLYNQHLNFLKIHKQNKFAKRYMSYLSHFEFGENHKSWFEPLNFNNFNDPNYWLEQWFIFYKNNYFKFKNHEKCFFLKYENFNNDILFDKLLKILDLKMTNNFKFEISKKKVTFEYDSVLLNKSRDLYNNINDEIF